MCLYCTQPSKECQPAKINNGLISGKKSGNLPDACYTCTLRQGKAGFVTSGKEGFSARPRLQYNRSILKIRQSQGILAIGDWRLAIGDWGLDNRQT